MKSYFNKYTFLVLAIAFGLIMAGSSLTQATSSTDTPPLEKNL